MRSLTFAFSCGTIIDARENKTKKRKMVVYKLTDSDGYTRKGQDGETKWEVGVRHELPHTDDPQLCSSNVYHAYSTPYNAALFDPIHGKYNLGYSLKYSGCRHNRPKAILWECETTNIVVDDSIKTGVFDLTPIQQIELPILTVEQSVEIAIRLTLLVCENEKFINWANAWITDENRSSGVKAYKAATAACNITMTTATAASSMAAMKRIRERKTTGSEVGEGAKAIKVAAKATALIALIAIHANPNANFDAKLIEITETVKKVHEK